MELLVAESHVFRYTSTVHRPSRRLRPFYGH